MSLRRRPLAEQDLDALRDEVVTALRGGELCVLPTETVYGLTSLPSHPGAAERASTFKQRDPNQPFTWHVASIADVEKLGGKLNVPARRLLERYWPGPLTLILAGDGDKTIGVRMPSHDFTKSVIEACGEPLWMSSVNESGKPPLVEPDEIASFCQDDIAVLVDDGPSPIGMASTIVRADRGELEVLREGILSRNEVLATAADAILFVCTGNTCRSPLAEAMAREMTAQAMGVDADRVLARGLRFASAGTSTGPGMPASDGSLAAGAEIGLDLSGHESQPVTPELVERATAIYCLGDSHRRALLAECPEAGGKVQLLRQDGLDIADPFGGDLRVYQRARDEIRAAVQARVGDWWP